MAVRELIDKLNCEKKLSHDEWVRLIKEYDESDRAYAAELARGISQEMFGKDIYIRGIVEFSNICKNDCLYCGIRRSNGNVSRYRLTAEEIPARYMKMPELADLNWSGFSSDERMLIDSLKKNAVTVMIRLMIANKKRNFH